MVDGYENKVSKVCELTDRDAAYQPHPNSCTRQLTQCTPVLLPNGLSRHPRAATEPSLLGQETVGYRLTVHFSNTQKQLSFSAFKNFLL